MTLKQQLILTVIPQKEIDLSGFTPKNNCKHYQLIKCFKAEIKGGGWAVTRVGQVVVPPLLLQEIAWQEHEGINWGERNLKNLKKVVIGSGMTKILVMV